MAGAEVDRGVVRRPNVDSSVLVRDGRRIGVAEYGDPNGHAVLWFHGLPGGRHQIPPAVQAHAAERGLRVISVERPGIGRSTNYLYRRIRDFVDDVDDVTANLGVDRYAVVGLSAGGAYAQAVAHQRPERTMALALLCSVAPGVGDHKAPEGRVNQMARTFRTPMAIIRQPVSQMLWLVMWGVRPIVKPVSRQLISRMPEGDAEVLSDPVVMRMFVGDVMRNSTRQFNVVMNDTLLFGRHWGFDIRDITVPTGVWVGGQDRIVPPDHGFHLARSIPNARLFDHPEGGHLLGIAAGAEVLDFLSDQVGTNAGTGRQAQSGPGVA